MATEETALLRKSADVSDGAHQLSVVSWAIFNAASSAKDDVSFQLAR